MTIKEKINFINKDIMPTGCSGRRPSMTRMISQSGHIPSSVTLGRSETKTRGSRSHECRIESGRSMVEMLGVLAVIGVLSIGGIAGYSYGMDKYRANETTNQIMLRAIDLMTQASQGNETLSLAGWNNESAQYDFGTPEYTDDGLIVFDVGINEKMPKRICEIVYEAMKDTAVQIDINAARAESNDVCADENEMSFYFEGGIGGTCDPACPEGQYCDNGICFKGGVPEGTNVYKECSNDDDCGQCGSCYSGIGCIANASACTIDGKDGLCRNGECHPKGNGCTTNNDCTEPGTYCASPNSSETERFQDGETGSCVKIDFVKKEINGEIYYISNAGLSWWDAEYACDAIGSNIKMVSLEELTIGNCEYKCSPTPLMEELSAFLGEGIHIWTRNVTSEKDSAVQVTIDNYINPSPLNNYHSGSGHLAVCH